MGRELNDGGREGSDGAREINDGGRELNDGAAALGDAAREGSGAKREGSDDGRKGSDAGREPQTNYYSAIGGMVGVVTGEVVVAGAAAARIEAVISSAITSYPWRSFVTGAVLMKFK
jgi:hypothetical protein